MVGRLKLFGELSPSVATIDEDPSLELLYQPLFRNSTTAKSAVRPKHHTSSILLLCKSP
jgi:hypothetical protein